MAKGQQPLHWGEDGLQIPSFLDPSPLGLEIPGILERCSENIEGMKKSQCLDDR